MLSFFSKPIRTALAGALVVALGACRASTQASTPQQPQAQQPYYPPPYGQPGYQPPPYGQPPYGQPAPPQPAPQQAPQQQPPPPVQSSRPLLAPLVGTAAMQQEVRNVLGELVGALSAQNQGLVRGIPLVFDPSIEVNAFAGCDERGAPYLAATTGILEAVDAIAQTKATDELFGTRTYDAYANAVLPQMVQSDKARAALPAGIIPANLGPDPRRWSRAHELFDDIIAFTFGHELAHHYLGHTGCAKGQPAMADLANLGRILSNVAPAFNQFQEGASDQAGTVNALDAGRRRRPQYEWSEVGGVLLLDYFARLESAAGGGGSAGLGGVLTQFLKTAASAALRSHPNPGFRLSLINGYAWEWRRTHPG